MRFVRKDKRSVRKSDIFAKKWKQCEKNWDVYEKVRKVCDKVIYVRKSERIVKSYICEICEQKWKEWDDVRCVTNSKKFG